MRRSSNLMAIWWIGSTLCGASASSVPVTLESPVDPPLAPVVEESIPGIEVELIEVPEIDAPAIESEAVEAAVAAGIRLLIERQEGPDRSEWPYQGVYRVSPGPDDPEALIEGRGRRRTVIPIGYRVGGTSIAGRALLRDSEIETDGERRAAVDRARSFVVEATGHPSMTPDFAGGYDVRGWGYIYGLGFLLDLRERGLVPPEAMTATEDGIRFYVKALEAIEIPEVGGWNYARRGPLDRPDSNSPFMTPPGIQALREARRQGFEIPDGIVERALSGIDFNRGEDGHIAYASRRQTREPATQIPGAIGRMLAVATVRSELGLADAAEVRQACTAFLNHWGELLKRKGRNGTHQAPYGVAPYYFMYAHGYAAEAIERLPEDERPIWRDRLTRLLMSVHDGEKAGWNDRVFDRSAAYGTSIAVLALTQPDESSRMKAAIPKPELPSDVPETATQPADSP